jgi:hypothetical protein
LHNRIGIIAAIQKFFAFQQRAGTRRTAAGRKDGQRQKNDYSAAGHVFCGQHRRWW